MVTLTAGGKSFGTPTKSRGATVHDWDALVTRMLEHAVAYGRLDALYQKRKAWCDEHWDHDQIRQREDATYLTLLERNETAAKAMDLADALTRMHASLPPNLRNGLEALMGHELWPMVPQQWLMAAKETQSTDIAVIVFHATVADEGER